MAGITRPRQQITVLKKIEKELTCAICLEPLNQARLLHCNHVFCKECLALLQTKQKDGTMRIDCPTCRNPTLLSAPSPSSLLSPGGIDELQDDPRIYQLREIQQELMSAYLYGNTHESSGDQSHDCCSGDKRSAHLYGINDGDYDYCSKHDGNRLELYCEECSEVICIQCAFHHHADHRYDLMSDMIKSCEKEIETVLKPLEERRTLIRNEMTLLADKRTQIADKEVEIREAIKLRTQQLRDALEVRKNELISELNAIVRDKLDTVARDECILAISLKEMDACLNKAKEHMKEMSEVEIIKQKISLPLEMKDIVTVVAEIAVNRDEETIAYLPSHSSITSLSSSTSSTTSLFPSTSSTTSLADVASTLSLSPSTSSTTSLFPSTSSTTSLTDLASTLSLSPSTSSTTSLFPSTSLTTLSPSSSTLSLSPSTSLTALAPSTSSTTSLTALSPSSSTISLSPPSTTSLSPSQDHLLHSCSTHGKVYTHNISPTRCKLLPPPPSSSSNWSTIDINTTLTLLMEVCDTTGAPSTQPIISMQCELTSSIISSTRQCEVKRKEPHHYKITCKPLSKGNHLLSVKVEGQHIRGSPFEVMVTSPPHTLGVPIRVIDNIQRPRSICVDKTGKLVISETKNHCLSVYSKQGEKMMSYGCLGNQPGEINEPRGLAMDRDGRIVVVDGNNHRLQVFDREGRYLNEAHTPGKLYNYLTGITISPVDQRIYVVDSSNHCIHVFDHQMKTCKTIGKQGNGKNQFQFPLDVSCDGEGRVYVADCDNHRIQVLSAEGRFIRKFGREGTARGELRNPAGISIGPDNLVYVCESGNNRVSVFTLDGKCVSVFGRKGHDGGEFNSPRAIKVDEEGLCYVCDTGNNRVQIF